LRHGSFEFPFPGSLTSTFLGRAQGLVTDVSRALAEFTRITILPEDHLSTALQVRPPLCCRCRANMAHIRQSRSDYGLGFQVFFYRTFLTLWPLRSEAVCTRGYTLHPSPCTLHPAPYTLHPTPYCLHARCWCSCDKEGETERARERASTRERETERA